MYHYTMCGLDNVWLANGYTVYETPYGRGVSIHDADGLHRALALRLADKPGRLTGKELRFLRTHLGLSQAGLAKMLDVTDQAVSLWERTGRVPKSADTLIRMTVLAKLDGDRKIGEVIERISTVERMVSQRIVAREYRRRWTSTVQDAATELTVA
ncbi:MAG: helix-turn-helix domain-containing protein [Pseudomonadota bacterium]